MARRADAAADFVTDKLHQLLIVGSRKQAAEFLGDDDDRTAMLDLRRPVNSANEGRDRFGTESLEILGRLGRLLPLQSADVVQHEAIDDLVELVLFFLREIRQTRRVGATLRFLLLLGSRTARGNIIARAENRERQDEYSSGHRRLS